MTLETDYASDAGRWAAVTARDQGADGRFFYGVCTTGIVCRPGCASRRPRRRNVVFFDSLAAAVAQGFRLCKRCRPASGTAGRASRPVVDACRLIESRDPPPRLAELAGELDMSTSRLHRLFRRTLGITPKEYAEGLKAGRFRRVLEEGGSVTDAVYEAGYGSASRAYDRAAGHLGMTPGTYRERGRGVDVRFATATCRLGAVAVAATPRGVCAVELGDSRRELASRIRARFSGASRLDEGGALAGWIADIVRQIDSPGHVAGVPLDIQGTAFQLKVWRALREIPCGETRSYAEVARGIGQPRAARAVARACASNELAVVVPCHRVVRSDGAVSGYRWGEARKRALLDDEAGAAE